MHGGGFVLGDLDTSEAVCSALVEEANCLVASVDYRLAPEHPFLAPAKDCFAALRWIEEHVETYGGDASYIAVRGDSAGGTLAAVDRTAGARPERSRTRPPVARLPNHSWGALAPVTARERMELRSDDRRGAVVPQPLHARRVRPCSPVCVFPFGRARCRTSVGDCLHSRVRSAPQRRAAICGATPN